jgi:acetyltransferase-like isoleucine patch superfamily enzyme
MLAARMSEHPRSSDQAAGEPLTRAAIPPEPPKDQVTLRTLAGRAKRGVIGLFPPPTKSEAWLKERGMLVIGRHSYGKPNIVLFAGDSARVSIGSFCSLASEIEVMPGGNHPTDMVTTYPLRRRLAGTEQPGEPWSKGDVAIGNDVWIGRGVKILGGVTIGDGAVIAAYSVVTKDIPPYAIAAGVPARVVRTRFSEEVVERLLRIRWWEWDDAAILERVDDLTSTDLDAFTRKYDPSLTSQ